ncbi:MAG TPA: peptidoglycan DD-metalloendopeptidase family protein [Thermoanaerobaculia bacterium]|nr:peptidoglycan DD-metalloendopeptidase family protein [Thermoanaerobaculia bacterium]
MKILRALDEQLRRAARRTRFYAALALPIAIPLFVAAVRVQPELDTTSQAAIPPLELRYDELRRTAEIELPEHSLVLSVEKNDTLDKLLLAGGLSRGESAALANQIAGTMDVRRLRPGNLIRFHYDRNRAVDSVQIRLNAWGEVHAVRTAGGFDVSSHPLTLREVERVVSATIETSLYEALREAGEGPQLVQQIVDVFQWDIDFFQLRKGDSFSLVVARQFAGNELAGYGPVLAARFTHRGTTYEAFRHEQPDGSDGYYAANGTPLRKEFLKAPLKFSRVTSKFTRKRYHPVLKYFRPHYGVDYGAPAGTPVMSTADGVVVEARFSPSEGNFVRVRHSTRYDTCYLHLSRFAKGLKKGARVRQGEIIGYVGSTGLATGAHLDYRVSENGKWIDPLKMRSVTPDPLRGAALTRFRATVAERMPRLSAAPSRAVAEENVHERALF